MLPIQTPKIDGKVDRKFCLAQQIVSGKINGNLLPRQKSVC